MATLQVMLMLKAAFYLLLNKAHVWLTEQLFSSITTHMKLCCRCNKSAVHEKTRDGCWQKDLLGIHEIMTSEWKRRCVYVPSRIDTSVLVDNTTNNIDVILGNALHLQIDIMAALFFCTQSPNNTTSVMTSVITTWPHKWKSEWFLHFLLTVSHLLIPSTSSQLAFNTPVNWSAHLIRRLAIGNLEAKLVVIVVSLNDLLITNSL